MTPQGSHTGPTGAYVGLPGTTPLHVLTPARMYDTIDDTCCVMCAHIYAHLFGDLDIGPCRGLYEALPAPHLTCISIVSYDVAP